MYVCICVCVYVLFIVYHVLCITYHIYFVIWYPGLTSDDGYTKTPGLCLKPLSHETKILKKRIYENIESQELNLNTRLQFSIILVFSQASCEWVFCKTKWVEFGAYYILETLAPKVQCVGVQ